MTTYKKLTWDSYKIQVESAVRDGNGATISTTYATKTELSTGLGNKLDTTTAASTYLTITSASSTYLSKTDAASTYATQTALSNGLAGKADTATTLGGYGITDGVTTNTAQNIPGSKSFVPASGSGTVVTGIDAGDSSTARTNGTFVIKTNTGNRAYVNNYEDASNVITQLTSLGNVAQNLEIISNKASNEGFAKCPYRAYNSANVYDIVTIGSLAANPNVVHTTGNENIAGNKRFTGYAQFGPSGTEYSEMYFGTDANLGNFGALNVHNGTSRAILLLYVKANGDALLRLYSPTKGTVADIATL